MNDDSIRHTDEACLALFAHFFRDTEDTMKMLAPEGWENSPLMLAFHPTPQQQYKEALRMHRNIESIFRRSPKKSRDREPQLADFEKENTPTEIKPQQEFIELLGLCLWDIFSDNHEVVSADGKVYDIGSFRGAGGFIADYLNERFPEHDFRYGYLDFYMGTIGIFGRADLTGVYEWLFRQLKQLDCDWIYFFPRLSVIDFRKSSEETEADTDMLAYDAGEALAKQLEQTEKNAAADKLRQELDDMYESEVEAAKYKPLPKTVQAYQRVYGHLPCGWPHG